MIGRIINKVITMARIIAIRTHRGKETIDGAVVVQDDDDNIAVYGEDKILRQTVKQLVKTGIDVKGETYEGPSFMDGLLIMFNRKPFVWSVEMNEDE